MSTLTLPLIPVSSFSGSVEPFFRKRNSAFVNLSTEHNNTLIYTNIINNQVYASISGVCDYPNTIYISNVHNVMKNSPIGENDIRSALLSVDEISKLPENWNENGAPMIDSKVIDEVRDILSSIVAVPSVFPTPRNSIQLEFHEKNNSYLEFEVSFSQIKMLKKTARTSDVILQVINKQQINDEIRAFYAEN